MSDNENTEVITNNFRKDRKKRGKYSNIWRKFTIINNTDYVASCNTCGVKLSFRTTVSNLKKHLERKHGYDVNKSCTIPYQVSKRSIPGSRRPNLTELGGLDGLILNVVGDEGGDPGAENVGPVVEAHEILIGEEMHDYCVVNGNQEELEVPSEHVGEETARTTGQFDYTRDKLNNCQQTRKVPTQGNKTDESRFEKNKRSRIMDLQLECLEIKKYNMQMEALMLEQQLNLPRSIFTQTLQGANNVTRGTQTDVAGNNTKVFYVTDSSGAKEGAHLFTFQASVNE